MSTHEPEVLNVFSYRIDLIMEAANSIQALADRIRTVTSRYKEEAARTTIAVSGEGLSASYSTGPFVYNLYVTIRLHRDTELFDVGYQMDDLRDKDEWDAQVWENNERSYEAFACGVTILPDQATIPAIETWMAYLFRRSSKPAMFSQQAQFERRSWRDSDRTLKGFVYGGLALGFLVGYVGGGPARIILALVLGAVGYVVGAFIGVAIGT
jgi:hypothetical protein